MAVSWCTAALQHQSQRWPSGALSTETGRRNTLFNICVILFCTDCDIENVSAPSIQHAELVVQRLVPFVAFRILCLNLVHTLHRQFICEVCPRLVIALPVEFPFRVIFLSNLIEEPPLYSECNEDEQWHQPEDEE